MKSSIASPMSETTPIVRSTWTQPSTAGPIRMPAATSSTTEGTRRRRAAVAARGAASAATQTIQSPVKLMIEPAALPAAVLSRDSMEFGSAPVRLQQAQPDLADGREAGDGVPEPVDGDLAGDGDGGRVQQLGDARAHEGGAEQVAVVEVDYHPGT